jgi:transcriptional regulator with XRE-family HTH domain
MGNGDYLKAIGAKVKAARLQRKMTLQAVAPKVGLHYSSLSFIENGKNNMHVLTLKSLADLYGMEVKDFL